MSTEPVLDVDDIQGMIIPGYRKPAQDLLHFRISDPAAARLWLAQFSSRVASAAETNGQHRRFKALTQSLGREPSQFDALFYGAALSATGLRKLVQNGDVDTFGDASFTAGLAASSPTLGDPTNGPGSPDEWVIGGNTNPVDVMLVVAADDAEKVETATNCLIDEIRQAGLENIHIDHGRERPDEQAGHEQFGFKDGISMPSVRGLNGPGGAFFEPRQQDAVGYDGLVTESFARPGVPLLWPGQVLFGYARQDANDPASAKPGDVPIGPSWSKNGSFLVFRRLRQDTLAFEGFIDDSVQALNNQGWTPPLVSETLAARLMGRWKSGAPISLYPDGDPGRQAVTNDFGFANQRPVEAADHRKINQNDDTDGLICPRGAHIRKVNPRDLSTDRGPARRTLMRLPLRRGITYDATQTNGDAPSHDKGLLFIAFHSSIEDSFEFLMKTWIRHIERPEDQGGFDPVLSRGDGRFVYLNNNGHTFKLPVPGGWITPTGGEYMFMPSKSFLKSLGSTPMA